MFGKLSVMRRSLITCGVVTVLILLASCGGGEGQSSRESTAQSGPDAEQGGATRPKLTPLVEAQYADRVEKAVGVGETAELRYYPEDIESFDLDETETIQVTVEQFEVGALPCGPDDEILSVCDGSVTSVYVVLRADNPNDVSATVPEVGVLSPDGQNLALYFCPGGEQASAGSEMLPTTTVTITVCFGSDSPLASLSGWLVKANTLGLVPEEGAQAYWIHD